ncbi:MAG: DUF935 family protein [Bacteroidota bacterium]
MARKGSRRKPQKNPAGEPISIVNNKIEIVPFQRKDGIEIPDWRSAHRSAESLIPNYYKLYSLYSEILLDAHVTSVIGKRIDPITNANWSFVDKEGKPVDEIQQLIDTIGFEDLLQGIMMSRFWGYKMMEPKFWQNGDGEWEMGTYEVPYLNMRPHLGVIAYNHTSDDGIDVRSGMYKKTIMEVGKASDLGKLLVAAPYAIYKRGGFGDYSLFVQVFGMPIVDAQWDGVDEGQRQKLNQAIIALGSGGALVRPKGTDVNLLQNKSAANGDLQDGFIKTLNKEISKGLLGSTETTESSDSSGYAQGKIHQEEDDEKNESDLNFVRRILNSRFRPILRAHGFDTKGGRFITEAQKHKLSVEDVVKLKRDAKLPVSDDFLYEKFGIPKPENYEELKKDQESKVAVMAPATQTAPGQATPNDVPGEDEPEENQAEQLSFVKKLLHLFSFVPLKRGESKEMLWNSPHDQIE